MTTVVTEDRNTSLMARRTAAIPRGVGQAHALFVSRARNAELWDAAGRRYIDFCGGIAVVNTGHCHPRVMRAVAAQLEAYTHTCFQVVAYESYVALAEKLNALAPGAAPKKTFFMSTGAEAVENAVKIARAYTKRTALIAFAGGFHGRTMMGMALTGKVAPYKVGFGPFPAEIYHAPYPCPLHGVATADALDGIETLFKNDVDPARVAAIIIEPVQGEGGYYPAPADFLVGLRALCDRHGILLIADEIQTGIGRTGKMFAVEHSGVVPDIITLAKGLGGGLPISAIVGRADVMDAAGPGGLGGTYAGSPLGCAAALAVLDAIEEEKLLERALAVGARMQTQLALLAQRHVCISDVRGLGAMVAVEFCHAGDPARPAAEITRAVVAEARNRGLLLLACGNDGNIIRIMAPLTISDAVADEGLSILASALDAVIARG